MHILRESILYLKRKHTHIILHRSEIKNKINFDKKYSKKGFWTIGLEIIKRWNNFTFLKGQNGGMPKEWILQGE